MWVRRSSCESVTDREELVGRLSFVSRLPQYLFVELVSVATVHTEDISLGILDHGYIDRSICARAVGLVVGHCWVSLGFRVVKRAEWSEDEEESFAGFREAVTCNNQSMREWSLAASLCCKRSTISMQGPTSRGRRPSMSSSLQSRKLHHQLLFLNVYTPGSSN